RGSDQEAIRRASAPHVVRRSHHPLRIVVEEPECGVAFVANEPAHLSGNMAMVDAKPPFRFAFADRAGAVLRYQHPIVIRLAETVDQDVPPLVLAFDEALAKFGVRRPLFPPLRVEPIAVAPVPVHVAGKLPCPILRILGIAFPFHLAGSSPVLALPRRDLIAMLFLICVVPRELFRPILRLLGISLIGPLAFLLALALLLLVVRNHWTPSFPRVRIVRHRQGKTKGSRPACGKTAGERESLVSVLSGSVRRAVAPR